MKPARQIFSSLVRENVKQVLRLRAFFDGRIGRQQRWIERATLWMGRPMTLYLLMFACCAWVAYNLWLYALIGPQLDPPPFIWLQGALCLYGALIATMVLAAQNRRTREAEQRAHLQLQMQMVTEQKTTKIIELLEALRHDLPSVQSREDPVLRDMLQRVDPHEVLSVLENVMDEPMEASGLEEHELSTSTEQESGRSERQRSR